MAETIPHHRGAHGRPSDPGLQGRFIQAALDLLSEHGYRALTTAAIAERAGASTASLYRRWSSKQALVSDVARTLTLQALAGVDTGSLEGDLREFIYRKRALIARVGAPLLALLAEAAHDAELRETMRAEVIDATTQHLNDLIGRGAARGELAPPPPEVVGALAVVLIGSELVSRALATPGRDSLDIGADAEISVILRLLEAPADAVPGGERE